MQSKEASPLSAKLTEQICVRLSEKDVLNINQLLNDCGEEMNPGKLLRIAWKFFHKSVKEKGMFGLLTKLIDEDM